MNNNIESQIRQRRRMNNNIESQLPNNHPDRNHRYNENPHVINMSGVEQNMSGVEQNMSGISPGSQGSVHSLNSSYLNISSNNNGPLELGDLEGQNSSYARTNSQSYPSQGSSPGSSFNIGYWTGPEPQNVSGSSTTRTTRGDPTLSTINEGNEGIVSNNSGPNGGKKKRKTKKVNRKQKKTKKVKRKVKKTMKKKQRKTKRKVKK